MKKRFTILMTVLFALTLITRTSEVMGQNTSNFTLSSASSVTQDGITASFAKGSGSTDPAWYAAGLRLYASNTVTISSANDITGIAFAWEKQGNKAFASVTANTGSYTHPTTTGTGTWSGSANEVVFTLGTSGQLQLNTFSVTTGGSTPTTYTVTFDANGGTFVANTDFANTTNTVTAGTYTLPSATPPTGYTFEAWNIGQYQYQANASYTVSGNADFVASYTQNGGGSSQTLTFDFEDETAHRTSGSNSYTGTNTYSENGATITLTYADAVTSGTPIDGSANVLGRVAKNTTNSPVVLIGPIDITGWTISKIEYKTKGVSAMSQLFESSLDNSTWTTQNNLSSMPTTTETETVDNLSITGTNLYLRWTVSVSSSTSSNRDFQLDDIVITYTDASTAAATTTTISVPSGFNTDLHNGTTAGTLTATVTSEGSPVSGATVTWSSSETSVATVGSDGAVTLVAVGTTTITAAYAGVEDVYKPSSDTYELTVIDSYAPGTQNNPYTVAQAIANTPSSGDVYIQGIVSSFYNTSIVGDGSNYRYYISDDGTTTTQLLVYKGKGLNQTTFSNVSDLLVGDEVVIYGSLVTFQNAPEVASGNYLYSWNRPAADVEAPTFSPAAGTFTTTQNVTMSSATSGADIYYTTDGTTPDANSTLYDGNAISVSTTTTFKAIAYYAGENSTVTTATYHFCSPTAAYTVAQALNFVEYPANNIYVHGIVSTAPTSLSSGTLTYKISDDGTTTSELEVYKGKDLNDANFTSADDIQVGDIVTVSGNVIIYNNTKEFAQGNYLVSFERPAVPYDLTVSALNSNVNGIFVFNANDQTEPLIADGAAGTVQVTSGTSIMVSPDIAEGYVLETLTVDGNNVTSQVTGGEYTFTMPTHAVTISATAMVAPATEDYELYSGALVEGDYLIVYDGSAMNNSITNNRLQYASVSAINDVITTDNAEIVWHIAPSGDNWTIYSANVQKYAASTNSNNQAQLVTEGTEGLSDNAKWVITAVNSNPMTYEFVNVARNTGTDPHAYLRNNKNTTTNYGFACYAAATGGTLSLYKKVEPAPTELTKTISAYGTINYYLIASPFESVTPSSDNGFITDNYGSNIPENPEGNIYDLYKFDQTGGSNGKEWRNYRQNTFNIEAGKGYLYASKNGTTLVFDGTLYSGDGTFGLTYDAQAPNYAGWNLVGNPYTTTATIDKASFYRMNSIGTDVEIVTGGTVNPMEGIFVLATTTGQSVTFTQGGAKRAENAQVSLNIVNSRGNVIDRAIVSFDENGNMPKFMIDETNTKIYFPQSEGNYAIVSSNGEGSMPVNFKAKEIGQYTISVETEGIDLSYLHLIDRLTGDDINLLLDSKYSFIASNSDMESRFILSFGENGINANNETFAFQNGSDIIVNGEGELQIFDVTGRMVKNTVINGIETIAMPQGVYIFRLNENIQKIVVR